jgi:hypothetical protein
VSRKDLERRSKKYAPVQNVSDVNRYMDAKDFHQKYKTGRVGLKKRMSRASASRPSGEWNDDDFDVLSDGEVVGRIMKANAAPVGSPWLWTLAFGHHEDRTPRHGCAATREAAMAALAKSWRRE